MLWLALFPLLCTLLAGTAATADVLLTLAASFTAAAMPCLAAAAAPAQSLPLSLAGAADSFTAAMFAAAEERLQQAQLCQARRQHA